MTAPSTPTGETYTPPAGSAVEAKNAEASETLKKFLERHKDGIVAAAANKISPERVLKVALIAATKQPLLTHARMDKVSVLRAIIEAASLGLEIGAALGEAYLVPFKTKSGGYECQMMIGYRGIVNLARRSGSIVGVDARPVFEGEQFEPHYGTDPKIVHVPSFEVARTYATLRAVYVVWHLAAGVGGGVQFDIMSKAEVDAIRKRSKASDNGPWVTDYIEMAKKTVTKRGGKLIPMSVELADAIDDDTQREFGDLELGAITEEGPTLTTEVKEPAKGAAALLREKAGTEAAGELVRRVNGSALEEERIEKLKARVAAVDPTLTDDDLDELRLWREEHPAT